MPTIYLSYILGITPVFKRGSQSDPTCYHLIGALPSLSQVFEQLLVLQLWLHIDPYIPHEQFSFIRGPSSLVAGVSLAFTITTAINQYAEAMDIKGAFDSVCWKGLVAHLWSIGFQDKVFRAFESYFYPTDIYELLLHLVIRTYTLLLLESPREQYGLLPYLICIFAYSLLLSSIP